MSSLVTLAQEFLRTRVGLTSHKLNLDKNISFSSFPDSIPWEKKGVQIQVQIPTPSR